ncbi:MAG TPA: diacylglycerol kinase family protein [Acidimicrobiia bacterium]|nr:diacylglycerol kinase family protein [Acidimicrobiia bacterium]
MRRLILVANPAASGFTASLHRDVVSILQSGFVVTPVWPDGAAEARVAAADAAAEGYDIVVAMGGDGVAHQVANGLIGSETALGVVPAGTTNVLRRVLGLPRKPLEAARVIARSQGWRFLPTMRLESNGPDGEETRHASFAAGVGFDAEVIRESEKRPIKKVGAGTLHYVRSTLRVALGGYRRRRQNLRVTVDGRPSNALAAIVQVHDTFTYLGRRSLSLGTPPPVAVSVRRVTATRLARLVARAMRDRPIDTIRGIEAWPGFARMTVDAEPASWMEADGELIGRISRLEAIPEPARLRVVE